MEKTEYELIVCIVNSGFSEQVMAVAREAGARGGTITHCRGTSNLFKEQKYGVYITPEKEMVLIVTKQYNVDKIITAVYQATSKENPGSSIVFSLPVSNVVGLKFDQIVPEETENNL